MILRIILTLVISFGLLWVSEEYPVYALFEPQSTGWTLWMSYAKDLIQPFAFYFFISLGERWIRKWQIRATLAFGIPTLMEVGQFFYPAYFYRSHMLFFGVFDWFDLVMYALGVGLAVLVEQKILIRRSFWKQGLPGT